MPKRQRSAELQLLRTKFYIPTPGEEYVARPRLLARLNVSLKVSLTVLAAPAGFGKTTLLAAWCAQLKTTPTAWLALEAGDDESTRFLTYLCGALQTVDPALGADAISMLQTSPSVPAITVLTALINSFLEHTEPMVLVLDDAHVLETETVSGLLGFLIEHCPPNLHLVIATRTDPNLPLARYRGRGQLNELRAQDLRFTLEETGEFLNETMQLELARGQVQALETRTEGWIAGLQLAALSIRGRTDRAQFITAFHGSHRFILDYLIEQVLSQQAESIQTFLLRTSILERLNASLCQAVTEQPGAQGHLEWLESHNLFLMPLDDEREWYRYHRLFADVLQHRLRQIGEHETVVLHRRASQWFKAQGYYEDAIHHAMAAKDWDTIAEILEWDGIDILLSGKPQLIEQWLDVLPEKTIVSRPLLACAQGILLVLTERLEAAGERLLLAERLWVKQGTPHRLGLVRAWIAIWRGEVALHAGDLPALIAASRQGLKDTPEEEDARLPLLVRLARAFQITGDVTEPSERELAATFPLLRRTRNLYTQLNSVVYLARLQTLQGHLHRAMNTFERGAELVPSSGSYAATVLHPVYSFGRAAIFLQWNRLDLAEQELERGLALTISGLSVDADALLLGYTTKIQVQKARRDLDKALETIGELERIAVRRKFVPAFVAEIQAQRALVQLALGNFDAAFAWQKEIQFGRLDVPDIQHETVMMAWTRVELARAEHDRKTLRLEEAARLLARWEKDAEKKARRNSVIEIVVLRARIASLLGARQDALDLLERAVGLGEPENYVRVFAEEGAPIRQLLSALPKSKSAKRRAYLDSLLAPFDDLSVPQTQQSNATHMADVLSAREIEVLRLIARGSSNQEIADTLIIAVPTVKRHISTIYAKLNVTSRTQAVARSQGLKLL